MIPHSGRRFQPETAAALEKPPALWYNESITPVSYTHLSAASPYWKATALSGATVNRACTPLTVPVQTVPPSSWPGVRSAPR